MIIPSDAEALDYFDWVDDWLEFCNTRQCPACPFYPCHGDFHPHIAYYGGEPEYAFGG